jgi:hypothetical protein
MDANTPLSAHVVAFLDLLGFRALVHDLEVHETSRLQEVKAVLDWMHGLRRFLDIARNSREPCPELELSQFSDSVILSCPSIEQATTVVLSAAGLAHVLLLNGLLCRGAITHGLAYHHGGVAFGSAIIDAYDAESRTARSPRIVLSDEVYSATADIAKSLLLKDCDGLWFIDLFAFSWQGGVPSPPQFRLALPTFLRHQAHSVRMMQRIRNRIEQASRREASRSHSKGEVREKLNWVIEQFNGALVRLRIPNVPKITIQ